ncbi:MAG: ABC transporter permease, partial [Clostridia bacterium]|nr:ABC transporter permease [Clostridia bacterium]
MNTAKNLYKNRFVLYELVRKNVKTQYRNSFLGMLWTILNPLLNMLVMWLVFSQFFGRNDPLYPIYLLTGNILFSCLSSATNGALQSIVNNRGLLTRIKIDSYLFPLSSTLSSLVNLAFSTIALLLIMLGMQLFGGHSIFSFRILTVFLMVPAFVLFEYGIGLFLSALYVFARDIKYLYSVFITLWTYITPIFYKPETMIKAGSFASKIIKLNPMYYFVRFFRDAMYMGWSEYPIQDLLV